MIVNTLNFQFVHDDIGRLEKMVTLTLRKLWGREGRNVENVQFLIVEFSGKMQIVFGELFVEVDQLEGKEVRGMAVGCLEVSWSEERMRGFGARSGLMVWEEKVEEVVGEGIESALEDESTNGVVRLRIRIVGEEIEIDREVLKERSSIIAPKKIGGIVIPKRRGRGGLRSERSGR